MPPRPRRLAALLAAPLLALGLAVASAAPAEARDATAEERARVEAVLRAAGYTSWDDIEFKEDRGVFEVDDAQKESGGPEFDVVIEAATMRIASERRD